MYELPYNTNKKVLSTESGLLILSVALSTPADTDITLEGTATINGHALPITVNIPMGETEGFVLDAIGTYFANMYFELPLLGGQYLDRIKFGK